MKNKKVLFFDLDDTLITCSGYYDEVEITMPNVPKPLHAINPRIIMGQDKWDNLRMQCYLDSKYKCEICDRKLDDKNIQLHELYSYNHTNGVAKFERYISVCKLCHNGIHSGRAASLFRNHNPIFTKKYMLEIAENAFKLVYEYNEEHHAELRLFKTYLEWLRLDELRDELLELMTKYDVKIYRWPRSVGKWERWHLEWNGQKYYTPYHNGHEWRADMREKNKSDYLRHLDLRNP